MQASGLIVVGGQFEFVSLHLSVVSGPLSVATEGAAGDRCLPVPIRWCAQRRNPSATDHGLLTTDKRHASCPRSLVCVGFLRSSYSALGSVNRDFSSPQDGDIVR